MDTDPRNTQTSSQTGMWPVLLTMLAVTLTIIASAFWLTGKPHPAMEGGQGTPTKVPPISESLKLSYQGARYDPIHFKPAIDKASNDQCLACHKEVLETSVREKSPAGYKSADAQAWYQRTSTYTGDQDTFHRRHLTTDMARNLMPGMRCNTCHQGNDPRDEAPNTSASNQGDDLRLRKMVDPEKVCLMCHGKMNWQAMGLPGPWEQSKAGFQNNCMLCHAGIRTDRHRVNFLDAKAIEVAAAKNGDTCFGCHGGRAWYRTTFPYPRHPWQGMPAETPEWAKARKLESDPRFAIQATGVNK